MRALDRLRSQLIAKPEILRALALGISAVTGFAGLVYEVTWHRYLANLIGSQAKAAALILAVFLGGLSGGYLIFGQRSRKLQARRSAKLCGILEIGIGLWALCFPNIYDFFWRHMGIINSEIWVSEITDFLLCVFLMGLPTIFMGGTLPLLTQGLSFNLRESSRVHAKIYAINTAGAFLGCLCGGMLLIPFFGLPLTMLWTGLINLTAGLALVALSRLLPNAPGKASKAQNEKEAVSAGQSLPLGLGAAVAFLAGFYALGLQTVLIRAMGLALGSSEYAFCLVVSTYVLILAIGAWPTSWTKKEYFNLSRNQLIALFGVVALYFLIPLWGYVFYVIRVLLTNVSPNFFVFYFEIFLTLVLFLLLAVGAMGRTMPMLFGAVRRDLARVGKDVGILYGCNTLGCVFGAIFSGYVLLYFLNLDQILKINLLALIVTLPLLWLAQPKKLKKNPKPIIILTFVALVILVLPPWNKKYMAIGLFRQRNVNSHTFKGPQHVFENYVFDAKKLLAYRDGPSGTVAIVEFTTPKTDHEIQDTPIARAIVINGKSDGSTRGPDLATMRLTGHLPALVGLSDNPTVAVVGYGTGITVGSLSLYPGIKEIHCIEISPFVQKFAPYFDPANHGASNHPKVRWHIGDAYRVLGGDQRKYRLIVSEPSNPWVTGVDRLFARDFYQMVSTKLDDKGVYGQWFHTYSMSQKSVGMIINTFASVFPQVRVFKIHQDFIIVGSHHPFDHETLARAQEYFQIPEVAQEMKAIGVPALESLLAMEIWLPPSLFADAGYNTLEFPRLTYQAGFDFFLDQSLDLDAFLSRPAVQPVVRQTARQSLLFQYLQAHPRSAAASLGRVIDKTCQLNGTEFSAARQQSLVCRNALTALAVSGQVKPHSPAESRKMTLLQEARSNAPAKTLTIDHAAELFQTVSEANSVFLDISPERLQTQGQACLKGESPEHLRCRAWLDKALFAIGAATSRL